MITVTPAFKTAVKSVSKEIRAYITDGVDLINESNDLQTIKLKAETTILKTVMRYGEASYLGTHAYLDKTINIAFGVVLADLSIEYINYGSFIVTSQMDDKANNTTKIKFFDKMYKSLIKYDLDPIYERTFPCTLLQLLQAICTRLSWTLATTTFPNHATSVTSDAFTGVVTTYRELLDYIAEASGSIIYFDINDQLTLKQIAKTGNVESFTKSILESLELEGKYGNVEKIVLSRMPQEDNIAQISA